VCLAYYRRNHNNGLNQKKQEAATVQTTNEGTNTQCRQVFDALVRRKYFNNFKEEKFQTTFLNKILMNCNRNKLQRNLVNYNIENYACEVNN
jgi:hypothetical protein